MNAVASQLRVDAVGVTFVTTHWSVVLTAQGHSAAADEALEKLCRTYWWPLYGFVRRNGSGPEEAQDSLKLFLRGCSNGVTSKLLGRSGDVCVLICWHRSRISCPRREIAS